MNCQPGDTAFIVRNTLGDRCLALIVGRPVTVTTLTQELGELGPAWNIKNPFRCMRCGVLFDQILDADLQPIRGQKPSESVVITEDKPEEVTA